MLLIDAHCHLQDELFKNSLAQVIQKSEEAGIGGFVCCGTQESDWDMLLGVYRSYPGLIIPSFGLHPWYAGKRSQEWLEVLRQFLDKMPQAGVGEIGLDFAIDDFDKTVQTEVFLKQLELAQVYKRPVSIHCRKAEEVLIGILKEKGRLQRGGIIHSYSGSADLIPFFCEHGLSISFSGAITRSNNKRAQEALFKVPLECFLIETDSPDILPAGVLKPNVPSNLLLVVEAAASFLKKSRQEIIRITSENTRRIFIPERAGV